jgi:hypothetical protein
MSNKQEVQKIKEMVVESERERPEAPSTPEEPLLDERISEDGPLISEVEAWKTQFEQVFGMTFPETYIWRPLNRVEYKSVLAMNLDPSQREEVICEICVLWPKDYAFDVMAVDKAGIPTTLCKAIMETSGFREKEEILATIAAL